MIGSAGRIHSESRLTAETSVAAAASACPSGSMGAGAVPRHPLRLLPYPGLLHRRVAEDPFAALQHVTPDRPTELPAEAATCPSINRGSGPGLMETLAFQALRSPSPPALIFFPQ